MAYPKNTINVGAALEVIASDTIPIPTIGMTPVSGTTTSTTTDKLVDSNKNFISEDIRVGDIVYNTTNNTVATVTSVDGETELSLSANIMATGQTYTIYLDNASNSSDGCLLYIGSNETTMTPASSHVNVTVKTVSGSDVTFSNFLVGEYLPVQVIQLYTTGTSAAAENNCVAIW